MASDLHHAIWDGPFDALLADGRTLIRGAEHLVTSEDLKSAHWLPVKQSRTKTDHEKADS